MKRAGSKPTKRATPEKKPAAPKKKPAAPKKKPAAPKKKPSASKVEAAESTIPEFMALGPEINANLRAVATLRGLSVEVLLREAARTVLDAALGLADGLATIPIGPALGPELCARVRAVALKREMFFDAVLREAVQKFLESELVDPTTDAKDDALYPPTDKPLEEAPVVRAAEPSEAQVHERATLPGEVAPDNGTTN